VFSLFKRSVDSIIADIQTRIDQLHIVAEAHAEAAKLHSAEIEFRTRLVATAEAEYARAKSIATKFGELIS
jgi:hypothetical protein